MRSGTVLLVGRPNVGKSTLINVLVGQKVSITSPKPQTTRFPIRAVYRDKRGEILFTDTPGIFGKAPDLLAQKINAQTLATIEKQVDVLIYLVDQSRRRDYEEGKILGIVRNLPIAHKLLVINKIDKKQSYLPQYEFLKEEFPEHFIISARKQLHLKPLIDKIFTYLPEVATPQHESAVPLVDMDTKLFLAELIREKVFLMMDQETPYTTTTVVDEIVERPNNTLYIKARILTVSAHYKPMLIGQNARKIKEIGSYARKEIALFTGKKVYLDLTVAVDRHWMEQF